MKDEDHIILQNEQALWIEARLESVERWASHLLTVLDDVQVVTQPRPGLIMVQLRDSVEMELFCLGEALITECQIACRGQRFWGRALGEEPIRSLGLAILAAARSLEPEALDHLKKLYHEEYKHLSEQRDQERKALGATRVQFNTMTQT